MPWTLSNAYCALADVREALRMDSSYTSDDNRLALAINAASRAIEGFCDRKFWQDSSATPRTYVPITPWLVEVDDFQDTTGLVIKTDAAGDGTFGTTWDTTDYQLEPLNAKFEGQPWAYTAIRAIRNRMFPVYGGVAWPLPYSQALIQVTAKFGWTSIPDDVAQACIIQAIKLYKAADAPFGATPIGQTGTMYLKTQMHPDAAFLLGPYVKEGVHVA